MIAPFSLSLSAVQQQLAESVSAEFAQVPQVLAVALAGSQTVMQSDSRSDLDIYIYHREEIPVKVRAAIAEKFAQRREINNQFWEVGDEWIETHSGCRFDLMYRIPTWMEEQIDRILVRHQASVGYSTCFWWNLLRSFPLYDGEGWLQQLQQYAQQPYPEALKQAIVSKNYPILRHTISSYTHQIEIAIARRDWLSANHRTAAFLASYFDILFAINGVPHPGEKRLVQWVSQLCNRRPDNFEVHIQAVLEATTPTEADRSLLAGLNKLADGLDRVLTIAGWKP